MAIYVFSGVDRPKHLALLAAEHAAGMVNMRNATHPALLRAYAQWPQVPLALDCGAPQGQSDIGSYIAVVEQVGQFFHWISNLDVIGAQHASDQHFEYLQSHLPSDLRQKILWVFQTDGSLYELEHMARERRFVGLGGLVPMLKRQGQEAMLRYLLRVGERLRSVNAQAHAFGLSSPFILFRIRSAPWLASVDSSKWLVAYKASQVIRRDGTGQCHASQLGLCLTLDEMAANNIRVMQHYWVLPVPIVRLPLLFEEPNVPAEHTEQSRYEEEIDQFSVLLRNAALDAFLQCFGAWVIFWEGSDEENAIILILRGHASLEDDLVAWCEEAVQTGSLAADYDVYCEEEAIAA